MEENLNGSGAFRIVLTCPYCGNSTFCFRDDDYECLACGDVCQPEEMSSKIVPVENNNQ